MQGIVESTASYERWLSGQLRIIPEDLELKHRAMRLSEFAFLRATFYRWAELWPKACPDLAKAPAVLAVGDLHVENFGTWRDEEGRLCWGINDFDEAFPLPYTLDLVRLAVSAHIAIAENHLAVPPEDACTAILQGYEKALQANGIVWVLAEEHAWLREVALSESRDPVRFWEKVESWPALKGPVPGGARRAIERLLPRRATQLRVVHRQAGLGSLGRERYTIIYSWKGARIAREAKPLIPSACVWAADARGKRTVYYRRIVEESVRNCDPYLRPRGNWIGRRLSPDCSRVELNALNTQRDELRLLEAMGAETANVHLGTPKARAAILADLKRRNRSWLHENVTAIRKLLKKDWELFRETAAASREHESKPQKKKGQGKVDKRKKKA